MFKVSCTDGETSIKAVIQLISVCVTFLTLIISILKIITKYVFPEKEEEYITRIVEIIQNNDLENKKENIRVKTKIKQEIKDDAIEFKEF
jgi:H+/Cl- antiporter ClcA